MSTTDSPKSVSSPPSEAVHQIVCDRVKDLRKRKNWTLEQLAAASGVSRSMLSQIERGSANPTLGVAFRIAQAFGMTLGDLVDHTHPVSKIDKVAHADPQYLFRDDEVCTVRTLSPLHLEKDVEFYEIRLKPNAIMQSAAHFQGTRELLTVQHGNVAVVSGEDRTELEEGDSAHYAADVPHSIINLNHQESVALLVNIYGR